MSDNLQQQKEELNFIYMSAELVLKLKGKKAAINYIKEQLNSWETETLHCAVIGSANSGKSTFINVIRDMGDDEETSAPTDTVEFTREPADYQDLYNPNLVWSDLPGCGTKLNPRATYVKNMKFER